MGRGLEDGGNWDSLDSFCLCLCLLLCFRSVSRFFSLFRHEEESSEFDGLQVCCMRWRGVRKGRMASSWQMIGRKRREEGKTRNEESQAQLAQGKRGCTNALGSLAARKNA